MSIPTLHLSYVVVGAGPFSRSACVRFINKESERNHKKRIPTWDLAGEVEWFDWTLRVASLFLNSMQSS